MHPESRKTAVAFHAKDDLPEVRKEVFALLHRAEGLRYFAVVADKWRVLAYVRQQNERNLVYRYHPNELYDYLARRLFKNLLHKDGGYEIVFSNAAKSDRTAALRQALEAARERFAAQWRCQKRLTHSGIRHHPRQASWLTGGRLLHMGATTAL